MSEGLPWMKLFVGREALRISGLPLGACGAYFRLILLTWERGPVKTTTAELFLGCTLASLGEAFADLLTVQNDVVSVDSVERERGARTGVSKQAASAANARWEKERMRPHYDTHTERNAERNTKKREKESKEGEEDGERKESKRPLVSGRVAHSVEQVEEIRKAFIVACKAAVELNPDRLAPSERSGFLAYWTEQDKNGKMRFEHEKFFDHGRRMDTWSRTASTRAGFKKPEAEPAYVETIEKIDPNATRY
jgi:hypothetical protein